MMAPLIYGFVWGIQYDVRAVAPSWQTRRKASK
jgi:hypothetical protein